MKKVFLGFAAVIIAAVSVLSTSCDRDIVSSEDKLENGKTATVVFMTGVKTTNTAEYAPVAGKGAKLIITAKNDGVGSKSTDGVFTKEVALEDSGEGVKVELPVKTAGATAYVATCVRYVDNYSDGSTTEECEYYVTDDKVNFSVYPGAFEVVKVVYQTTMAHKVVVK
jgi:lipoprotein